MFRATYMEVQKIEDEDKLVYIAWHTPDDHPPRSYSENTTCAKGQGCAGLAWQRGRPLIEDEFKDGHEWKDVYPGQGELYESMTCVPVTSSDLEGREKVIGVITVDTDQSGFFGKKHDRLDEDRAGKRLRSYGDYIAFITIMDKLSRDLSIVMAESDKTVPGL